MAGQGARPDGTGCSGSHIWTNQDRGNPQKPVGGGDFLPFDASHLLCFHFPHRCFFSRRFRGRNERRLPPMMRAFLWRFRPIDAARGGRRWLDNACWMSCPNKSNWMLGSACRADSGADVTTEAGSVAGSSKKKKTQMVFISLSVSL